MGLRRRQNHIRADWLEPVLGAIESSSGVDAMSVTAQRHIDSIVVRARPSLIVGLIARECQRPDTTLRQVHVADNRTPRPRCA